MKVIRAEVSWRWGWRNASHSMEQEVGRHSWKRYLRYPRTRPGVVKDGRKVLQAEGFGDAETLKYQRLMLSELEELLQCVTERVMLQGELYVRPIWRWKLHGFPFLTCATMSGVSRL